MAPMKFAMNTMQTVVTRAAARMQPVAKSTRAQRSLVSNWTESARKRVVASKLQPNGSTTWRAHQAKTRKPLLITPPKATQLAKSPKGNTINNDQLYQKYYPIDSATRRQDSIRLFKEFTSVL